MTVIEYLSTASCPAWTATWRKNFQRMLQKQGFAFKLSSKVTGAAFHEG